MHIIRYHTSESPAPLVGVRDEGQVFGLPGVGSLAALWALPVAEIRQRVAERERVPAEDVTLLPPIDGRTEVWAAGVTYFSSREARVEESERSADVYRQVYDAERPELFFKSAAWRVAGDGQTVAVRADSTVDVPEPEVALVINRFGEIAGYTACNDLSSRSIEGQNPLYLPQAKIYLGGCALGPAIRPSWEVADPYDLGIELTIRRDGVVAWQGRASTSALRRRFDDLAGYLMRADIHPDGVVLSTGTCLVPPAPFSLADGDVVAVAVDEVGVLTTGVVRGLDRMREAFERQAVGRSGVLLLPWLAPDGAEPGEPGRLSASGDYHHDERPVLSIRFRILPFGLLGSSSTKMTDLGFLNEASCRLQCAINSAAFGWHPGTTTT